MNRLKQYEQIVLGSLMVLSPDMREEYLKGIESSFFTTNANKKLFKYLSSGGNNSTKYIEILGDPLFATELTLSGDMSRESFEEFRNLALAENVKTAAITEDWERLSDLLAKMNPIEELDPITRYEERKKMILANGSKDLWGFSTGIPALDRETKGFQERQIWVCGGYYGYGKTWFAIGAILEALKQNKRVLFFSLEMSAEQIIERLVGLMSGMRREDIIFTSIPEERERIEDAEKFIKEAIKSRQLVIEEFVRDRGNLVAKLASENKNEHIDLLIVDYIQLLASEENAYESLREAAILIQGMTKQIACTTLLLSQVSNETQKSGDFTRVDGFKGAGEIGQIADVAIKIARERDETTGKFTPAFGLNITKNRHGEPSSIKCKIVFPGGRIVETDEIFTVKKENKDRTEEIFMGL